MAKITRKQQERLWAVANATELPAHVREFGRVSAAALQMKLFMEPAEMSRKEIDAYIDTLIMLVDTHHYSDRS